VRYSSRYRTFALVLPFTTAKLDEIGVLREALAPLSRKPTSDEDD
jgi:hypothetical protein